jgi:hypothetical protein
MRGTSVLWYAWASGAVLAFLWLVGLPIQLLLDAVAGRPGRAVATPLFGLFVVTTGSWYVLEDGHVVSKLPVVLASVAAITSVLVVVVRARMHRPLLRRPQRLEALRNLSTAAAVLGLNLVVSLFTLGVMYTTRQRTALSLFNADPASYALHAQSMLDSGFRRSGLIVGYNMGTTAKSLGYGADALVASAAAVLRTDVVHVLQLTMLIANFLGIYGLVRLLNGRLGVSRPLAILAAQAGYGVFFVEYLQGNFFLSQMLAMALLPAFLALLLDAMASKSIRGLLSTAIAMGTLTAAGIAIYPQMVFLTAAIFVPAAAFFGNLGGLLRRTLRGTTALVSGFGLGVALTPALSRIGWNLVKTLGTAKAGWPFAGLLVTDMLGFQTATPPQHEIPHHSPVSWALSVAILLVVAATMLSSWRRPALRDRTTFVALALATILIAYGFVYLYEGFSYQQWKWITYFIPLFVALLMAQVLTTLSLVDTPVIKGPAAANALGGAYLLVVTALATTASFPVGAAPSSYYSVNSDMAALAKSPHLRSVTSVNINTNTQWDTMWLAYFLRNKQVFPLSYSYLPIQKPGSDWTVERNDSPASAGQVIPLNATYRLVYQPHAAR